MTRCSGNSLSYAAEPLPRCVPWQDRYREGVLQLFSDVAHKRRLWNWQFESSPFGFSFNPVVLVDREDQVVGFNGVMPVLAADNGAEVPVLWSCDFFLASAWRGQGLATRIKRELHGKSPVIMALGVSDKASDVLAHLGWVRDTSVESYRMTRRLSGWRSWVFIVLQLANRLLGERMFSYGRGAAPEGLSVSVRSSLPARDEVDALWMACAGGYERIVVRNFRYLDWRYQKHPLGRYAFVRAERAGNLAGILVVRTHGEHLRIVDYIGPCDDRPLKQAMIRHAVNRWRHVSQMSAVTSDDQFGDCLLAAGFVRLREKPRFYRYEKQGADKHWFIMAGDSDGEFLQAAYDFSSSGDDS